MQFAPPARLLFRPFRGYAALAEAPPTITEGALRLLFVIGALVAISATGRLAPIELVVATVSFAYVPIAHLVAFAGALRIVDRKTSVKRAFALFLAGHGPWMVTLLAIAFVCLFAPAESTAAALSSFVPKAILFTYVWSGILTFACLRRGIGLGPTRSTIALVLYILFLTAIVVSYFLGMGQLGPQLWGSP